jgi:hypothetical protein
MFLSSFLLCVSLFFFLKGSRYIAQAGLKIHYPPASASQVLGLQVYAASQVESCTHTFTFCDQPLSLSIMSSKFIYVGILFFCLSVLGFELSLNLEPFCQSFFVMVFFSKIGAGELFVQAGFDSLSSY